MVDSQFISESTSGYTDGPALHYVFAMSGESYANDDFDIPYDMLSIPYGITGKTILELFYFKNFIFIKYIYSKNIFNVMIRSWKRALFFGLGSKWHCGGRHRLVR